MADVEIITGDCLDVLPTFPDAHFDAVVTDPPYPCIKRNYGYWTEAEWFDLMNPVVEQCRRVLKPSGSAVFILQPNSERVGRMRTWLWEFMAKWGREWGMVQDAWWWNHAALPTVHCHRGKGLMRPSIKACVWLGHNNCYRNQDTVLWESQIQTGRAKESMALKYRPSGYAMRSGRLVAAASERGGSTPFNILPIGHDDSKAPGGNGHSASTPTKLLRWWTRYICPPGGLIVDPFAGSGTTGVAAQKEGRRAVLIEREPAYVEIARRRLAECELPMMRTGA